MDDNTNSFEEKFIPMLEKIREMFLEFGIKNLNMDEISRKLGISKKTLYRYVDSKEDLLGKMFEYEILKWNRFLDRLSIKPLNAIEKLFEVSVKAHEEMKNINPIVLYELKKYYESIYDEYLIQKREFIQDRMKTNLEKGIKEGLYRSDLNIEHVSAFYANYLVGMHNQSWLRMSSMTFDQVFEVMFDNHIRAISTPAGVRYYEKRKMELTNYLIKEQ